MYKYRLDTNIKRNVVYNLYAPEKGIQALKSEIEKLKRKKMS